MNPVSGGSPPNDRSRRMVMILREGDKYENLLWSELENRFSCQKVINKGMVIIQYILKYVSANPLEIDLADRIHPMCPIEE